MNANDNLMGKASVGILPEQRILAIGGSPRIHGNSDVLLKHILNGVQEENVPTEGIQLRDYYFKPCIGCERCRKDKICTGLNDGMHLLYPSISENHKISRINPPISNP